MGAAFLNAVDIANRGLQHCGISRITSFDDNSLQAAETESVYDKLRRAELRRNVWRFAIRQCAIRPITTGFMFLAPTLYASTTTYGFGAIVSMTDGTLWQSKKQNNAGNQPGDSSSYWELYCGPMCAMPYDDTGTTNYFAGELVYETPGDGTYRVYMSLQSDNAQDPRVPSRWDPTVQYVKDQVVRYYAAWASGTTYAAGDVVSYTATAGASPTFYVSLASSNAGNNPATASAYWIAMPSTLAPSYYDANTAYTVGLFATYGGLDYVCILASTGNLPTNSTYFAPVNVGTTYSSEIDFNLNQNPSSASYADWVSTTTYASGDKVAGSDGYIYSSAVSSNIGNNPVTDDGTHWTNTAVLNPWTTTNPFGTANDLWATVGVSLSDEQFTYPVGAGPTYQTQTKNVYRLPSNFLRRAPQDPKAGSVSFLGAPTGLMYDDWELQGNFIVTREVFPILLRFVADVQYVPDFDDMFCEGLGARIGMEVCERLTQSTQKMAGIRQAYASAMTQARIVNGIETGATEPPEDDYITTRI